MAQTNFTMQAGVPFSRVIRVVDGKNIWATENTYEIRAQLRKTQHEDSELIAELHPFMSRAYDLNDIVITWTMTGADVRTLRRGNYDIVLSDVGVTDAKAVRILSGLISVSPGPTAGV